MMPRGGEPAGEALRLTGGTLRPGQRCQKKKEEYVFLKSRKRVLKKGDMVRSIT